MSDSQALVKVEYGIDNLEKMGVYIAQSGLFGIKNPTQAVALMLISQAEGRHPASAAIDYHIIDGRPALKSDTMLARFQTSGGTVNWEEYTDKRVAASFAHPKSPKPVLVDWDINRAKQAGLGDKKSWKMYPRAMLRARVISEGVRTVYPAVLGGMYTPEEVTDFVPEPLPEPAAERTDPQPEDDITAKFEELVREKDLGPGMRTYLDEYMRQTAVAAGTELVTVMRQALKRKKDFWAGFSKWLDNQGGPEEEATEPEQDDIPY